MKKYLSYILATFAFLCAHQVAFNTVIGSFRAYFALSAVIAPVINRYCPLFWLLMFALQHTKVSAGIFMLQGLPTVGSACAYQRKHWLWSLAVPFVCQLLFWHHEVGAVAWAYACLWFIPMILFFAPATMLARATTAVFVSHAMGSVIWLYGGNIAPSTWMALIPVVLVERLLMIICMMAFDHALQKVFAAQRADASAQSVVQVCA